VNGRPFTKGIEVRVFGMFVVIETGMKSYDDNADLWMD
jgi:hypothetical protein